MEPISLYQEALTVLSQNDTGDYTEPANNLYPHQWLWDSCFIAIGLANINPLRGAKELLSLAKGQWKNGMLPNIIFSSDQRYERDRNIWRSWVNPNAPRQVTTTGITQPPMLAEAMVRVGAALPEAKRKEFYSRLFPHLVAYHQWLYLERDPHQEGLVLLVHPWEAGMDNSPAWMASLKEHQLPTWIRAADGLHLQPVINSLRRDTRIIPTKERFDAIEGLAMFDIQLRLRRKAYDTVRILDHSLFAIEDVGFNAILMRNNLLMKKIAKEIGQSIPEELSKAIGRTKKAFQALWDEEDQQFYSRDFITHRLIKQRSIASLLPLYSGQIEKHQTDRLVSLLSNEKAYGAPFPLPSVPLEDNWFDAFRYWQGPSWLNCNWLIMDGLVRQNYLDEAKTIRHQSLTMVSSSGCFEYFNPLTGEGIGTPNFSWTAALALDMALNPL